MGVRKKEEKQETFSKLGNRVGRVGKVAFPKYVHILNPEPCKYSKSVFCRHNFKELEIKDRPGLSVVLNPVTSVLIRGHTGRGAEMQGPGVMRPQAGNN